MIKIHDDEMGQEQSVKATLMHEDVEFLTVCGPSEHETISRLRAEVTCLMISLLETDWDETMFVDGDGRPLPTYNKPNEKPWKEPWKEGDLPDEHLGMRQ